MAWRVLMRRCPARSMTIVGDIAQTGALAGASSWAAVLAPFLGDRWRLAELTVNYRTPSEVMAVAADVLARVDPSLVPPASVRSAGVTPWSLRVPADGQAGGPAGGPADGQAGGSVDGQAGELAGGLAAALADVVAAEARAVGDGTLAVIVPAARAAALGAAVAHAVPDAAVDASPSALERRVLVLTVERAKGLEFDGVVIVEPAEILAGSARGYSDLYVALTRTTRRLGVVHTGELPAVLRRLSGSRI